VPGEPGTRITTIAHAINSSGQTVGVYFDSVGNELAFLFSGCDYTTIDPTAAMMPPSISVSCEVRESGASQGFASKIGMRVRLAGQHRSQTTMPGPNRVTLSVTSSPRRSGVCSWAIVAAYTTRKVTSKRPRGKLCPD
jgi:hypothetical protein